MANGKTNKTDAGEKRKSAAAEAFGRLSKREQTMIIALIVVGVVCALYFFVVQPGFDRLTTLEAEATKAEETQNAYRSAIAEGPAAAEQSATATVEYDAARGQIFSPLSIEELDSTVTGYLESAGFDPETLSMSQLAPEDMTPFSPQSLNESPVPESVDAQQAADDSVSEEASGDPDNPTDEGAQAGGSVYSYSATISAAGGWNNLYKLLGILADTSGVELTQYSYSAGGGENSDKGSFSMTMKVYVFIEEAVAETPTETGEIPAETETEEIPTGTDEIPME
jgi:hypothetical protein